MLYNLEPDHSVTGGAWYSDQDFESEFVEILNQQAYRLELRETTILCYSDPFQVSLSQAGEESS